MSKPKGGELCESLKWLMDRKWFDPAFMVGVETRCIPRKWKKLDPNTSGHTPMIPDDPDVPDTPGYFRVQITMDLPAHRFGMFWENFCARTGQKPPPSWRIDALKK